MYKCMYVCMYICMYICMNVCSFVSLVGCCWLYFGGDGSGHGLIVSFIYYISLFIPEPRS